MQLGSEISVISVATKESFEWLEPSHVLSPNAHSFWLQFSLDFPSSKLRLEIAMFCTDLGDDADVSVRARAATGGAPEAEAGGDGRAAPSCWDGGVQI
jgi:hypothetical protein